MLTQIEQWREHHYPSFVQLSDGKQTLDNNDPRTLIVHLEAERDQQLSNKKRLEEIRARMYPSFCFPLCILKVCVLTWFVHTGNGTNTISDGTSNGTMDKSASQQTDGGFWEAVLFMGGSLLLILLFCGAGVWYMMKWVDVPVLASVSHTTRVEL